MVQWPRLQLDHKQVASSSQPSAVDNSGGTSEDDEISDQDDEEQEAIEVSFLYKECGSHAVLDNTMA